MASEFGLNEGISAFVGALIAFGIDSFREKLSRHRDEANLANRALVQLSQMHTTLHNIWNQTYKDVVARVAAEKRRPWPPEIRALAPMGDETIPLDVTELSFLLRSEPDLPNRIFVLSRQFHQHLISESTRTQLSLEMQEKMQAANYAPGASLTEKQFVHVCGPKLWHQLLSSTNSQVDGLPQTIGNILTLQTELLAVLKWQFPTARFVKFVPRDLIEPGDPLLTWKPSRPALWRRLVRSYCDWRRKVRRLPTLTKS